MFCVNCGSPYDVAHRFCNKCGHATISSETSSEVLAEPRGTKEVTPETTTPPQVPFAPAPEVTSMSASSEAIGEAAGGGRDFYLFGLWLSLAVLALSFLMCGIAVNLSNPRHGFALALVSLVALSIFLFLAIRERRRQNSLEPASWSPSTTGRVLFLSICFAVVFSVAGAILGAKVGASGAATDAYIADLAQYRLYGKQLSDARNAAAETVPAQIAMYSTITSDVDRLQPVADRLVSEARQYEDRYPASQKVMNENIAVFQQTSKRCDLLRQQIRIADALAPMPPDQQLQEWRARMIPVLKNEDALDGR